MKNREGYHKPYKRSNDFIYILAVIIVVIAFIITVAAISYFITILNDTRYQRDDFETVIHTIQYGETPWEIASRFCPDTVDKRLYLEWCAKENGFLSWSYVYPGEQYVFLKLRGVY